jgi:hypothetical protein
MSIRLRMTCMVALCAILSSTALVLGAGIAAACSGAGGGGCEAPTASTGSASSITSNSATLSGSVNARGCTTYYVFEWGTSPSGPFPNSIEGFAGKETFPKAVSTNLTGLLQPGTQYYFRLSAINSEGKKGTGSAVPFKTAPACPAPSVVTEPASSIKWKSATLNGKINPHGCEASYAFEYRKSATGQNFLPLLGWTGKGTSDEWVSKVASDLEPNTKYEFRLAAANNGGGGTVYGTYKPFTTSASSNAYVAMGDSYSAGTGTGTNFEPNNSGSCHRTTKAYPYLLHNLHPEWEFVNLTCQGATTSSMISSQIRSPKVPYDTKWITYTIGGNDANFEGVIKVCVSPMYNVPDCEKAVSDARAFIETLLPSRLDSVNSEIKSTAPNAKVIVLDYPLLFRGKLCTQGFANLNEKEEVLLNGAAERLREVVNTATVKAGANFVFRDVIPLFKNHAICEGGLGSSTEWINGLVSPQEESYHPKVEGHKQGYYPLVVGVTG